MERHDCGFIISIKFSRKKILQGVKKEGEGGSYEFLYGVSVANGNTIGAVSILWLSSREINLLKGARKGVRGEGVR